MTKAWMEKFKSDFSCPSVRPEFLEQVRSKMYEALTEHRETSADMPSDPESRKHKIFIIILISLITIATVPLFIWLNYLYYVGLNGLLAMVLPRLVVQLFAFAFLMLSTLVGALCYGYVPIGTSYLLRNLRGQSLQVSL